MPYENFDVSITRDGDDYSITVRGSEGTATESFSKAEIKNLITSQAQLTDELPEEFRNFKPVADVAGKNKPEYNQVLYEKDAAEFGKQLSEILFRGQILKILGGCEAICRRNKSVLRIRLNLTMVPELASLPWEYLRTSDNKNFICLDANTTLVRYLQTANPISPINVALPLKVLVAAAVPQDLVQLDKNAEIEKIKTALAETNIQADFPSDVIQIDVIENATFAEVEEALENAEEDGDPYHVFHFIGHGDFEEDAQSGLLVFEDGNRQSATITHENLGQLIQRFNRNLRFVFLNACEGSRHSINSSYSSVASSLMTIAEIPAVLAMQFNISDSAAVRFATAFYKTLATGASLEKCVDEARMEIRTFHNAGEEWATPVFHLQAESGQLFEMRVPQPPKKLATHYKVVKDKLPNCGMVIFLGMDVNYYENWKPGRGTPNTFQLCMHINTLLEINPPKSSLASLAKYIEFRNGDLANTFVEYFNVKSKSSKLYRILGQITRIITDKLPLEITDPSHCSLLFVTTTYDSALENAFEEVGVPEYHVVAYRKISPNENFFSHRHFAKNRKILSETNFTGAVIPNAYTGLNDKFPVILKIPGEISTGYGFAITEDDFLDFSKKEFSKLLPASLIGQINSSCHLYLGYDLQSWTLRLIWDRICSTQSPEYKNSSYAVVFDENTDPNVDFWREKVISRASARIDDYGAGLEEFVLKKLSGDYKL